MKKKLREEIDDIRKLAGVPALGELAEQGGELTDRDADTLEDQINAALPQSEDKRWSVELDDPDEEGTVEIWVETYDLVTMEELNTVAGIVAKLVPIQFVGIAGVNRYLKFVFKRLS